MSDAPCRLDKELLSALLDDQLPAADRQRVQEHIDGCLECQQESSAIASASALLRRLPRFNTPQSVAARIRQVLIFQNRPPIVESALALAAALLLVLAASALLGPSRPDPTPHDSHETLRSSNPPSMPCAPPLDAPTYLAQAESDLLRDLNVMKRQVQEEKSRLEKIVLQAAGLAMRAPAEFECALYVPAIPHARDTLRSELGEFAQEVRVEDAVLTATLSVESALRTLSYLAARTEFSLSRIAPGETATLGLAELNRELWSESHPDSASFDPPKASAPPQAASPEPPDSRTVVLKLYLFPRNYEPIVERALGK
jgi:hypothetical protein